MIPLPDGVNIETDQELAVTVTEELPMIHIEVPAAPKVNPAEIKKFAAALKGKRPGAARVRTSAKSEPPIESTLGISQAALRHDPLGGAEYVPRGVQMRSVNPELRE